MTQIWRVLALSFSTIFAIHPQMVLAKDDLIALADEGQRLASLLRVGRGVISNNQDLINDPSIGEKGLNSNSFMKLVEAKYLELHGALPIEEGLTQEQKRLTEAQLASMSEVMDENQDLINAEGMGFKGFIPAVFARLVNERFVQKQGAEAKVKVTAPLYLVRNRKARTDEWETAVLTDKFANPDWVKGEAFYEEISNGSSTTFRMLIPEYYGASCLSCHGGPKGEVDVTGFPKEGGALGDLAGAISITLKR